MGLLDSIAAFLSEDQTSKSVFDKNKDESTSAKMALRGLLSSALANTLDAPASLWNAGWGRITGAQAPTLSGAIPGLRGAGSAYEFGGSVGDAGAGLLAMRALPTPAHSGASGARMALQDQRGMFAGVSALTADKDALSMAQTLAKQGKSPEDIWRKTGWFKSPDGNWKFEIDDSQMKLGRDASGTVDEIYHPKLFEAYPSLDNLKWKVSRNLGRNKASYSAITDTINIPYGDVADSSIVHELQHAIQRREGHSLGGSVNVYGDDTYRKLLGEVEARLAANRMNYSAGERRRILPTKEYDVPQQEVVFNKNIGLNEQSSFKTPFELAHETAQRNAALPVEQGGLGLPPNNTAMDRANVMFPVDAYHGTGETWAQFNPDMARRHAYGKGLHAAADPELANIFAGHSRENQSVMPLRLNLGKTASKADYIAARDAIEAEGGYDAQKITDRLREQGFSSVSYPHGDFYYPNKEKLIPSGPGQDMAYAVFDPKNIRSRFAAFDPMKKDSADILAGLAGMGLLSPMLLNELYPANIPPNP